MGNKQKKTGKGRLDKYYKLAKEQGYRARSAFKLIQLNKKYNFLESAKCCIDLCAAPGGWLQVASKYMPVNSVIVGVDLVPIKAIPRVITHAADITTPRCRTLLRESLKDWQADVVLHDGAPNVGTAWVQDAYTQSELVLMSLKLAVEFLIKGGTFVTKVFRSADYNNLLWVFNQLFGRVEATKPPSSRNVSAEIFVVCRDFLAPAKIDPKFLNPKHVFKELSMSKPTENAAMNVNAHENVFQPSKKRRQRDGYAEGDYTLFHSATAEDFVRGDDPITLLGTNNRITFISAEEKSWLKLPCTTEDVSANCADLKVLGKGDFKALLKWRATIREEIGLESRSKPTAEFTEMVEVTEGVDEEEQIQEELERLNTEATARRKRERRRANEVKTKAIQRMQLQMTAPMDIGMEQEGLTGGPDMFDLGIAERSIHHEEMDVDDLGDEMGEEDGENAEEEEGTRNNRNPASMEESDDDETKISRLEEELDGLYDAYRQRMQERDSKFMVKEERRRNKELEEWGGIREVGQSESEDEDEESEAGERGWDKVQAAKERYCETDSDSEDEDAHENASEPRGIKRQRNVEDAPNKRRRKLITPLDSAEPPGKAASVWFDQAVFKDLDQEIQALGEDENEADLNDGEDTTDIEDEGNSESVKTVIPTEVDDDDFEIVPLERDMDEVDTWDAQNENEDDIKELHRQKYGLLTPEALTLASKLVNREKTRTDLINDGFHRQTFNDKDGLPSWFLDEEQKYYRTNLPITKDAVAAIRAKQRALDARPIKKVAEAKARKKIRAVRRLEAAMKKAQGVSDTTEMSEREKAAQIEKLMKKGLSKGKKKEEVKVVVAKGVHKGLKGRPKGVKGRYVMVDARGKKELRATKRRAQKKGRKP
ncbi:FtsJ-domain-containing protein [Dacryopinax primogenitus]|uniref:FtsJ-domain-containing protein n=1 Tax=Dacryopinax primogenitus (strain DJM 731) TaxID=1858805 RepID=M5FW47_DACPD|nr:FtsJ-domain-containing protein [Dacryopinax primogenitus]EJT99884.1 FtsJ-domain-containing protein [Dacryopinax primogenitus]